LKGSVIAGHKQSAFGENRRSQNKRLNLPLFSRFFEFFFSFSVKRKNFYLMTSLQRMATFPTFFTFSRNRVCSLESADYKLKYSSAGETVPRTNTKRLQNAVKASAGAVIA